AHLLSSTQPPPPATHPLSLHDALPISSARLLSRSEIRSCRTAITGCPITGNRPRRSKNSSLSTWPTCCSLIGSSRICGREKKARSEEHTSELQSLTNLVCRLLLENKKA